MVRVAIVSSACDELNVIRTQFEGSDFQVRCITELSRIESDFKKLMPHLIVIRYPSLHVSKVDSIRRICERFPELGVIVCSSEIEAGVRFALLKTPRLALVHLDHERSDLRHLAFRIKQPSSAQRAHTRTPRIERLRLRDSEGGVHFARFVNFGQMGAQIQTTAPFEPRDRITLQYVSSRQEELRKVEAVVVWKRHPGLGIAWFGGHINLGIKFIAYL